MKKQGQEVSIKRAAMTNAASKYSVVLWNLIISAILARLLTPDDYGIVAVANVFIAFFTIFADLGLGSAVIQNKKLTKADYSDIFSFSCYFAIALVAVFLVASYPISTFYQNNVYRPVCQLLSLTLLFCALDAVPNALLRKGKQFGLIAVRNIIAAAISSIVAVLMAYGGAKYYALVMQSILMYGLLFIWDYITAYKTYKLSFHFRFSKAAVSKIKRFSTFQLFCGMVEFMGRNLDNLLISKFMGEAALGYYDKAYKLMKYPAQNLTNVISPVLHPILSDYQDNPDYIYEKYMKIIKLLSVIGVFFGCYCFAAPTEIITIVFGNNWTQSIPCFQILSLAVWFQLLCSSCGSVFLCIGRPDIMLSSDLVSVGLQVVGIVIGVLTHSIVYLSCFVTLGFILKFFVQFFALVKCGFHKKFTSFLRSFVPEIAISALIAVALFATHRFTQEINNVLISAIIKFVICGGAYAVGMSLLHQWKYFGSVFHKGKNGKEKQK